MPPFSLLIIITIIGIFVLSKNKRNIYINLLIMYCFLDIAWLQGVFITGLPDSNLSCARVVGILFTFYSLYYAWSTHINISQRVFIVGFIFLVIASLGSIYELLLPYDGQVLVGGNWDAYIAEEASTSKVIFNASDAIKAYSKVIIFAINAYIFKSIYKPDDLIIVLYKIIRLSYIIIFFGVMEYILKNVFNMPFEVYDILDSFFGGQDSSKAIIPYLRGETYNLQGFCRESSHFVVSLYCFSGIYLLYKKIDKVCTKKRKYIPKVSSAYLPLVVTDMFLSGGATAIWGLFVLAILYIVLRLDFYQMKIKNCFLVIIGLSMVLYLSYYALDYLSQDSTSYLGMRVNLTRNVLETMLAGSVTMQAGTFDSSLPRFFSVIEVFKNFLDRPLLGLGIDVQSCHDTTVKMLSDIGLFGVFAWISFVMTGRSKRIKYDLFFIVIYIFLMGTLSGVGDPLIQFYFLVVIESTSLYCTLSERKAGEYYAS